MASGQSLSRNSLVDQSPNEGFPAAAPVFATAQLSGPAAGLTFNDLRQVFCCSRQMAAATLGITVTCLKRVCHELNIERWPYRKLAALQQLQVSVLSDRELDQEQRQAMLRVLQEEVNAVMQNPNHNVVNLNAVRQRMYRQRAQHRKRSYGEASSPEVPHGDEEEASGQLLGNEEHSKDAGNAGHGSTGIPKPGTSSGVQQQPARRGRRGHAVQDWLQAHNALEGPAAESGVQLNPAAQLSSLAIGTAGAEGTGAAAKPPSPAMSLSMAPTNCGVIAAPTPATAAGPGMWDSAELLTGLLLAARGSTSSTNNPLVKDLDQVDSHPVVPTSSPPKPSVVEQPRPQHNVWQMAPGGRQMPSAGAHDGPQNTQRAIDLGMQYNTWSKQGDNVAGTLFLDSATSIQEQVPSPRVKHTETSTAAATAVAAGLERAATLSTIATTQGVVEEPLEQVRAQYLQERAEERARHREAHAQAASRPPGTVQALYL